MQSIILELIRSFLCYNNDVIEELISTGRSKLILVQKPHPCKTNALHPGPLMIRSMLNNSPSKLDFCCSINMHKLEII